MKNIKINHLFWALLFLATASSVKPMLLPDKDFGKGGVVATDLKYINHIAVQENGRIITLTISEESKRRIALSCYSPNGVLLFTRDLQQIFPDRKATDASYSIPFSMQGNKIIVAGHTKNREGHPRTTFKRYDQNGELDQSFNPQLPFEGVITSLALQPDRKIVIAVTEPGEGPIRPPLLVRYNEDGTTDKDFKTIAYDFNKAVDFDGCFQKIIVQDDGKIIIFGRSRDGGLFVIRYNSNGKFDKIFNPAPLIKKDPILYSIFYELNSLVLSPQGRTNDSSILLTSSPIYGSALTGHNLTALPIDFGRTSSSIAVFRETPATHPRKVVYNPVTKACILVSRRPLSKGEDLLLSYKVPSFDKIQEALATTRKNREKALQRQENLNSSPRADLQGELCAICLDEEEKPSDTQLPCGHPFHTDCIQSWHQQEDRNGYHHTCPSCRELVLSPDEEKVKIKAILANTERALTELEIFSALLEPERLAAQAHQAAVAELEEAPTRGAAAAGPADNPLAQVIEAIDELIEEAPTQGAAAAVPADNSQTPVIEVVDELIEEGSTQGATAASPADNPLAQVIEEVDELIEEAPTQGAAAADPADSPQIVEIVQIAPARISQERISSV